MKMVLSGRYHWVFSVVFFLPQSAFCACDANNVNLADYPQWQHEEGYWIGEYTFLGADGNPYSSSWNYGYDHYKGFITGNVQGNKYRQRNVFMYPPQTVAKCSVDNKTSGVGLCGLNGNMKIFEADQHTTTCSTNPEMGGDIEGPYGTMQYTYTYLEGKNNSLLYQVWMTKTALNNYENFVLGNPYGRCNNGDCGYTSDRLMQSQLTTLTQLQDGTWLRTRTAQGFDVFVNVGSQSYASFFRERKVNASTFYAEFNKTMNDYNITPSDVCAWKSGETGGTVSTGLNPGFAACHAHLEESFSLVSTSSGNSGIQHDSYGQCDASSVELAASPQWQQEEGYWIGEYTLLGADGNPSTSASWNYGYDHYKGFITGNVQGNKYRQRNVFMYPPQAMSSCSVDNKTSGVGLCGLNGNMKIFEADQHTTTCSTNPEMAGDIEGPYGSLQYTYTYLTGKNNSLLYQVWMTKTALNNYENFVLGNPYGRCNNGDCGYTSDRLMQSQLTTLTQLQDGTWLRTRTAQGFDVFVNVGSQSYASFYRERKVSASTFYAEFNKTMNDYNITPSDVCAWKSGETGGTVSSGLNPGFAACHAHLEESFSLSSVTATSTQASTLVTTTANVSSGFFAGGEESADAFAFGLHLNAVACIFSALVTLLRL